jgi:hypothetical protein
MQSADLRMRFMSEYKGDIKDPILTMLLDTLDAYFKDVQSQALLSTYAQRSDQVSDGLFEVLRRHLFGQMFPGPAYAVVQATLREVASARPLTLDQTSYFTLQDPQGNRVLFAPQQNVWIIPAQSNDVRIDVFGDDAALGFNVVSESLGAHPGEYATVYTGDVDPLLVERLRCRLPQPATRGTEDEQRFDAMRRRYPGVFQATAEFFKTPFQSRFLYIPFELLAAGRRGNRSEEIVWIPFQGIGQQAGELRQKLTLNAFPVWNLTEREMLAVQSDAFRFRLPIENHLTQETIVSVVEDLGSDPPIEYIDAATTLDPGYPFQYTSSADPKRDEILLSLSPSPTGDVRIRYMQYDLGEGCLNIAAGRSFAFYQGIDERVKSVQSLTPTQRIDVLNDKERVWNYFRSLLASRNRWVSRDDLRNGVAAFPPFASRNKIIVRDKIRFEEKVGRAPQGFLTPYTEILVPVRDRVLLDEPEKTYFQHELGLFLKGKSVSGNFVRVKLISVDDV